MRQAIALAIEGEYSTEVGLCVTDGHIRRTGIKCQLHGERLERSATVFDIRRNARECIHLKSRLIGSAHAQQAKFQ